ncbi:uncharacterized protein METZ01_LOCUS371342, partial [marine metagenome]
RFVKRHSWTVRGIRINLKSTRRIFNLNRTHQQLIEGG